MASEGDQQGLRELRYKPLSFLPSLPIASLEITLPCVLSGPKLPFVRERVKNHSLKVERELKGHLAQLLMLQNLLRGNPAKCSSNRCLHTSSSGSSPLLKAIRRLLQKALPSFYPKIALLSKVQPWNPKDEIPSFL